MKRWYGKLLGFIAGWLLVRHPVGAVAGLLLGHAVDAGWFSSLADNPNQIFGLPRDATPDEIDQAYRRLISQYHPDKYASLTEDVRRQAERKAGEINVAYDRIKTLRKR